jgi:WD40 repeat protein
LGLAASEGGAILKASLRGHRQPVRAIGFSPDSRLFAAAYGAPSATVAKSQIGGVTLWDVDLTEPVAALQWHRDAVLSLAFSPDEPLMATGSRDGTIAIWNVGRGLWDAVLGVREHSWRAGAGPITSLAFSADGKWLASGGEKEPIKLWDCSAWQAAHQIPHDRQGVCRVAFSPTVEHLAAVWQSRGPAVLWSVQKWEPYLQLRLKTEEDRDDFGLAFSPDGSRLAVLSANEGRIWDISTCQILTSFLAAKSQAIAWSPTGKLLATCGPEVAGNASIRLWDADTAVECDQLAGFRSAVTSIAFSADGKYLASGCQDATVNLWAMAAEHVPAK